MRKLQKVKASLKHWDFEALGNAQSRVSQARETLQNVQLEIATEGFLNFLFHKELEAPNDLDMELKERTYAFT